MSMDTCNYFTVTINARPLGIRFGHFNNNNNKKKAVVKIHQVLIGSYGSQIGLLAGDTLIGVNSACISYLPSSKALKIFRTQKLPFQASFSRKIKQEKLVIDTNINNDDNNSDINEEEDTLSLFYIKSNTPSYSSSHSNSKSLKLPFIDIDSYLSNSDSCSDTNTPLSISDSYSFDHKPSISMQTQFTDTQTTFYKHNIDNFIMFNDNEYYNDYQNIDIYTKHLVSGYINQFKYFNNNNNTPNIFKVLIANYLYNNCVMFDKRIEKLTQYCDKTKVITVSSNGFKYGIHEWTIKILKCDIYKQEIGVIENINNLQNIKCDITQTPKFGARALYGNELSNGLSYYVSINNNNNIRCKRIINQKIGWTQGAIIKTVLNLRKGNIQWFLNGKKVRKTISIEKGKIYYPIIAFSGNCQYELIDVN